MKYLFLFLLLVFDGVIVIGQSSAGGMGMSKPAIDSHAVRNWMSLTGTPLVSNDGNYIAYEICYERFGRGPLIIQSTKGNWRRELGKVVDGIFSGDSKEFVYLSGDTLSFLFLGTDSIRRILHVRSYKGSVGGKGANIGEGGWLVWQLTGDSGELVLSNWAGSQERRFPGVFDYGFAAGGHALVLEKAVKGGKGTSESLQWIDLPGGMAKTIWSGEPGVRLGGYVMDGSGRRLAFMVEQNNGDGQKNTVWCYKAGTAVAEEKVNERSKGMERGLELEGGSLEFSRDGRYIFFGLHGPAAPKAPVGSEEVDIWSYGDTVLQSVQLHQLEAHTYRAAVGVEGGGVVRLERNYEQVMTYPEQGDYVLVRRDLRGDRFWLKEGLQYELLSMRDGSRKLIVANRRCDGAWFSPGGRYFVYYKDDNYYSYDLVSGKERNISGSVPKRRLSLIDEALDTTNPDFVPPLGIGGWLEGDRGLLVYEEYDIWRLDPSGERESVNMTEGYGRSHHIKFRVVDQARGERRGFGQGEGLLLVAFNTDSKYNGFYRARVEGSRELELLTMGPWTMDHQGEGQFVGGGEFDGDVPPVKAGGAEVWVVRRSTAREAPNYYVTSDFKTYRAITQLSPQAGYNWLTTELMTYPQLDGSMSQGVLYMPEDFDPGKKYPVIVQYYEQFSHRVYEYPTPDFARGEIDIPWYVSRGYLVFTPDIHYHMGHPGESTCNAVVGAGCYLSKLRYVDSTRMGINGHSWGGFETYYLVTHSHLFAAALAGAGGSGSGDWISSSFSITKDDESSTLNFREPQMGATLWDHPELYLENSPVLHADRVTTPLLIFHCKADENWEQAMEMFTALRRLGKRTWLLQYDHGSHTVWGSDCEDYTIRSQQFFDHYLKGTVPPKWMTVGIPARLKGLETGYEADSTGRKP